MSHVNEAIGIFDTLGIPWRSSADLDSITDQTVKRHYRRLALKLHPDKNKHDSNAESKFNALKAAHDKMMNAAHRAELIHLIRGKLIYLQQIEQRNAQKHKLAEKLDQREREAMNHYHHNTPSIRQHHRDLIDELQARRDDGRRKTVSPETYPLPDDTVTDLNYWIEYSFKEPLSVRAERQKKFSEFISRHI
jgi:curved DNA-binding protein CbpA